MDWIMWVAALVPLGLPVGALTIDRILGLPAPKMIRSLGPPMVLLYVVMIGYGLTTGHPVLGLIGWGLLGGLLDRLFSVLRHRFLWDLLCSLLRSLLRSLGFYQLLAEQVLKVRTGIKDDRLPLPVLLFVDHQPPAPAAERWKAPQGCPHTQLLHVPPRRGVALELLENQGAIETDERLAGLAQVNA